MIRYNNKKRTIYNKEDIMTIMEQALGKKKADRVFKNGTVFNVFTKEWERKDVAVSDGVIVGTGEYDGKDEIDCTGKYIVPGFIDSHIHLESTLVNPKYLITEAAKTGTTCFIVDPHEAANVSGTKGIDFIIEETEDVPASCYIMMPSCVPCIVGEESGARLMAEDLVPYLKHPRVLGLGEVMDTFSVFTERKEMTDKLEGYKGRPIDGHNTGLGEKELNAYRLAGVSTNHEMTNYADAKKEIAKGFYCHIREGSGARNLEDIVKGIVKEKAETRHYTFCTDDKHISDILEEGHISHHIRKSISLGLPKETAYRMASLNAAECYGLGNKGAVAPGKDADLVILEDPEEVVVDSVYFKGEPVEGEPKIDPPAKELLHTVKIKDFTEDKLRLTDDAKDVIEIVPGQILTKRVRIDSLDELETDDSLNKICVVERHKNTGKVGAGIVKGYHLKNGALATSVSHDNHNIIAIGDSDEDLMTAIGRLEEIGGGYVLTENGKVVGELPLEIMGLMTNAHYTEVNETLKEMRKKAHAMGVPEDVEPFINPSFLALTVIPEIRMSVDGPVLL